MAAIGLIPGEGKVLGTVGEKILGVVYKRINPRTLEAYIGKTKSWTRFLARQGEHSRAHGVQHKFEVLGTAEPGEPLSHLEETKIRDAGGIQNEGGRWLTKFTP